MGLEDLADREGWQVEAVAARVHYRGDGGQYSVEYYAPTERVLYWRVADDGETASPAARDDVPAPLRERIRQDLVAADIDPRVEERPV